MLTVTKLSEKKDGLGVPRKCGRQINAGAKNLIGLLNDVVHLIIAKPCVPTPSNWPKSVAHTALDNWVRLVSTTMDEQFNNVFQAMAA